MRGVKTDRTASVVVRDRAFVQHLRRGRDELGVDASPVLRLAASIRRTPILHLIDPASARDFARPTVARRNNVQLKKPVALQQVFVFYLKGYDPP